MSKDLREQVDGFNAHGEGAVLENPLLPKNHRQIREFSMKSLNELRDEALRIAREHGFRDATPGEDLMLMVSELAEALEVIRTGESLTKVWYEQRITEKDNRFSLVNERTTIVQHEKPHPNHLYKPCGVPSEIADVIIRALHFAGKHGIDIEQAVREKMAYNETRPFKHGKKF